MHTRQYNDPYAGDGQAVPDMPERREFSNLSPATIKETPMQEMTHRVQTIADRAMSFEDRLRCLAQRLIGSAPEKGMEGTGQDHAEGEYSIMNFNLDHAQNCMNALDRQITRLEEEL